MMKPVTAPRRLYVRKSVTHVVFDGKIFGTKTSKIDSKYEVTCEHLPSDGGNARIQVTQRKPHAKKVVETWRTCTF